MAGTALQHLHDLLGSIRLAALVVGDQLHHAVPHIGTAEVAGTLQEGQHNVNVPLQQHSRQPRRRRVTPAGHTSWQHDEAGCCAWVDGTSWLPQWLVGWLHNARVPGTGLTSTLGANFSARIAILSTSSSRMLKSAMVRYVTCTQHATRNNQQQHQ